MNAAAMIAVTRNVDGLLGQLLDQLAKDPALDSNTVPKPTDQPWCFA